MSSVISWSIAPIYPRRYKPLLPLSRCYLLNAIRLISVFRALPRLFCLQHNGRKIVKPPAVRLIAARDAFETAESITAQARAVSEAPLDQWIKDGVEAHGQESGALLEKAERWTAAARATLKLDHETAANAPESEEVKPDQGNRSPALAAGESGVGLDDAVDKTETPESQVSDPRSDSRSAREGKQGQDDGQPEPSDDEGSRQESEEPLHPNPSSIAGVLPHAEAPKSGVSPPDLPMAAHDASESASPKVADDANVVGKLEASWNPASKPHEPKLAAVGKLPKDVWKEALNHQAPNAGPQPPRWNKSIPHDRDPPGGAKDEAKYPITMDGNNDETEEGEAAGSSRGVGRLEVSWGQQPHDESVKPAVEVGRLPKDVWKEASPGQTRQQSSKTSAPSHSRPDVTSASSPVDHSSAMASPALNTGSSAPRRVEAEDEELHDNHNIRALDGSARSATFFGDSQGVGDLTIEEVLAAAEAKAAERLFTEVEDAMYSTAPNGLREEVKEEIAQYHEDDGSLSSPLPIERVSLDRNEPQKAARDNLLPSPLPSRPLVSDSPLATLTSVLSQRPVGRVPSQWQDSGSRGQELEEVEVGRLRGDEYAPAGGPSSSSSSSSAENNSSSGRLLKVAQGSQYPAVNDVVGIVSRSKDKFTSRQPLAPAKKAGVRQQQALVSNQNVHSEMEKPLTEKKKADPASTNHDMKAIIGLVSRLVGVFDDSDTAVKGSVIQRQVPLSSNARRAKIDAALALAASRTRSSQDGKALSTNGSKPKSLRSDEMHLLESIFKSYDEKKDSQQMVLRDFAAAMSNPKVYLSPIVLSPATAPLIFSALLNACFNTSTLFHDFVMQVAALIRRVVNEPVPSKRTEEALNNLSVEALFDEDTIQNAAAVTLQAVARRMRTQKELHERPSSARRSLRIQ